MIGAAIAALFFALMLQGELLPKGDTPKPGLRAVLAASIVLIGIGWWLAWRDARRLGGEWDALTSLAKSRELVLRAHATTSVGERVRLVQEACDTGRVRPGYREAWRADAAGTLVVGSHARFIASTLLVLCVVGTFAGMKEALPSLIKAIGAAQGGDAFNQMSGALQGVADAFGANFLALLGSLMLGVTAYGASYERRDVLRALDRESERRLYPLLPQDADASELQRAVDQLNQSVRAVREVGDSIGRLDAGLGELKTTLRETLTEMHTAFSDSVRRHSVELQDQLNTTVTGLASTLGETSRALQLTAVSYEGLARGLEERDLGIRQATAAFGAHAVRAEEAAANLERSATMSADATARVATLTAETGRLLATTTQDVRQSAERVESAIVEQALALGGIQEQLAGVRADVIKAHEESRVTIESLPEALRPVLGAAIGAEVSALRLEAREQAGAHTAGVAGAVRESSTQLAAAVQESRRETTGVLRQLVSQSQAELDRLSALAEAVTSRAEQSGRAGAQMVTALEEMHQQISGLRRDLVTDLRSQSEIPTFFNERARAAGEVSISPIVAPSLPGNINDARSGVSRGA